MKIMNDYSMDGYNNDSSLPNIADPPSDAINKPNDAAIGGYGSLANSGYHQSINHSNNITKSQKDLMNRSYDFKNEGSNTR